MTTLPKTLFLLLPMVVLAPLACTSDDDVDLGQNNGGTTGNAGSQNAAGSGAKSSGSGGGTSATGGSSAATGGSNATGGTPGAGGSGASGTAGTSPLGSGGTGTPGSGGTGVAGWSSDLTCDQIKSEYSQRLVEARKCTVAGPANKCTKQLPSAPDEGCSCPTSIEEGYDTTEMTQLAAAWDDKKCPRSAACPKCAVPTGTCAQASAGGLCQ